MRSLPRNLSAALGSLALLATGCPNSGVVSATGGGGSITSSGATTAAVATTITASSGTGGGASTGAKGSSSGGASTAGGGSSGGHGSSGASSGAGGSSTGAKGTSSGGSSAAASSSGGGSSGGGASSGGSTGQLIQSFVGINGFPDDTVAQLSVAGVVREYHDWGWGEGNYASGYVGYPNNLDNWTSDPWDLDAFYQSLHAAGLDVMPCIEGGIPFVNDSAVPPAAAGVDAGTAAAYVAHADQMFQFAARYGSTPVATNLLKLQAGQPVLTGLGYLHYFENGNEEDAYWINPNDVPVTSATEMAAQCSADYDGDQGRLGATFGIKQADPTSQLVLSGMSQPAVSVQAVVSYLDGIQSWAQANRGGSIPFDVINLHYYDFGPSNAGISPEANQLTQTLLQYKSYRDQNMPGKGLWITEFGYDTDPTSPLSAPAIGSSPATITQAQWIVRSFLSILAGGLDRAYLYILQDTCSGSCPTQFSTSGIIDTAGNLKPAYYMLNTFRSRLATMRYVGQTSGATNVSIATFQDSASAGGAYVLWSPTSNGTTTAGYSLQLSAGATSATQVLLEDQQLTGVSSALTLGAGKVTVDVTETPTIVLVDQLD